MIVVDASIATKWIFKEESFELAELILQNHLENKEKIIVPNLLFIEVSNVLATKSSTTLPQIEKDLRFLFKTNLEVRNMTPDEIILASKLAKKYKTSVYDMLYAVVANKHKTILYTSDANFIKKTKFKFVKHLKELRDLS